MYMSPVTRVVNLRKESYSVYIGRKNVDFHYGNPFAISRSDLSKLTMPSREEALLAFHDWLRGTRFQDVEPTRRAWILQNLEALRGQAIGCFCKPLSCHGDIYRVLLGELTLEEAMGQRAEAEVKTDGCERREEEQMSLF